jgi:hypothetical protein
LYWLLGLGERQLFAGLIYYPGKFCFVLDGDGVVPG